MIKVAGQKFRNTIFLNLSWGFGQLFRFLGESVKHLSCKQDNLANTNDNSANSMFVRLLLLLLTDCRIIFHQCLPDYPVSRIILQDGWSF